MLSQLILNENIEYTFCTPSEYSLLLSYAPDVLQRCHSWRFCHVAGEALPDRLVEAIRELKLPRLMVTNAYGPAEAFVVTSQDIQVRDGRASDADEYQPGSIGYALPNTSVYITSESNGGLLPLGLPGEICIAGGGVFNGYLDAGVGDGKRVKNPFASAKYLEQGFDTMYKSGDRGILHEDGSIEFLGRCVSGNAMIKLRGLRIDLREITGAIIGAAPDDCSRRSAIPRLLCRLQTSGAPGTKAACSSYPRTRTSSVYDPIGHRSVGAFANHSQRKTQHRSSREPTTAYNLFAG